MSLRKRFNEEHSEVDTGPLNDILFILMFFFLILSTMANPNIVKLSVPKAKSESKAKQSVIVSIDKNRVLYVGHQRIIFDSLESELKMHINVKDTLNKPAVVINADSSVAWNEIIRVMQVSKRLGATTSAMVKD
jgi:biopolymer transport protein ExbD